MDSITIDGIDEHDFRYSIEDMLRQNEVERACETLRNLLEPHVAAGRLPPRFLGVASKNIEVAGWSKLGHRLLDHDRRGYPVSAIGIVLADAKALGGPGATDGKLAPFVKTYYFSDEAYPFTDATRIDLLDGYSRDGFDWQGDFQATDATLSIKGIDDLYGAVVALEDRLLKSSDPDQEEIWAGTIGACYLAVLIHRAITETVHKKGLPRPLCVLAACDGVYPFFNAPVIGQDECVVANKEAAELQTAQEDDLVDAQEDFPMGGSLLNSVSRKGSKAPVILVSAEENEEATRFTEMAGASRMVVDDHALKGVLQGVTAENGAVSSPLDAGTELDEPVVSPEQTQVEGAAFDWADDPLEELCFATVSCSDQAEDQQSELVSAVVAADANVSTIDDLREHMEIGLGEPARHALRARIRTDQTRTTAQRLNWQEALLALLRSFIPRIRWRTPAAL